MKKRHGVLIMTLDEAITSCMEVVAEQMELCREICPTTYVVSPVCTETAKIHLQLAEWLEELKCRRKQPEVRHGRWIVHTTWHGMFGLIHSECSECKFDRNGDLSSWKFCPNCGSDMREVSEDAVQT